MERISFRAGVARFSGASLSIGLPYAIVLGKVGLLGRGMRSRSASPRAICVGFFNPTALAEQLLALVAP
jgi:hypothetical protein